MPVGCKNSVRLQIRCFRGFQLKVLVSHAQAIYQSPLQSAPIYKAGPDTRDRARPISVRGTAEPSFGSPQGAGACQGARWRPRSWRS